MHVRLRGANVATPAGPPHLQACPQAAHAGAGAEAEAEAVGVVEVVGNVAVEADGVGVGVGVAVAAGFCCPVGATAIEEAADPESIGPVVASLGVPSEPASTATRPPTAPSSLPSSASVSTLPSHTVRSATYVPFLLVLLKDQKIILVLE